MNFTIVWPDAAIRELAAIWLAAADRGAVTAAADAIDRLLSVSPNSAGVEVFDTVREYTRSPLAVEFEVIDADSRVFILSVWEAAGGRPLPSGN